MRVTDVANLMAPPLLPSIAMVNAFKRHTDDCLVRCNVRLRPYRRSYVVVIGTNERVCVATVLWYTRDTGAIGPTREAL